ncbi:MAG: CBS domain-containing protein [Propionibacteriaceae bacterium]|nr:CBS domain-containing protein [Propionibacteriaceae bacterium]
MSGNTSIYISRVQGLPVVDAAGDQVGKVRDVVAQLRTTKRAPRIKGLVVELFARRQIFMPMARVHYLSAGQVSIIGMVDTRKFQRRESETLVIADLFDRAVPGEKQSHIFDVAMREVRSREWEIAEVAVKEHSTTGWLTGRGNIKVVPWSQIPALVIKADQSTEHLIAQFSDMAPADVARELHDMPEERRNEVVQALDDEALADALEELPEEEQVSLISALDAERAADILEEMDPDDAADLIRDLPEDIAEQLLDRMEPDEASDVRMLLTYGEFTAGGMMTPEPIILAADATVADALALARNEEVTPALASMVFVCRPPLDTPSGRYIGAVHLQRLLREPPSLMVSTMLDPTLEPLRPASPLAEVSRYFATYNLVVAPVVDDEQRLVGAVTVDDLVDHMLPDDWRGDQMDELAPELVSDG